MHLEEIKPEFIEGLYKKTGLKPIAGYAYPTDDRKCCALGVMIYDAKTTYCEDDVRTFQAMKDVLAGIVDDNEQNFRWFAFGFDDGYQGRGLVRLDTSDPAYAAGFRVGEHLRKVKM